MKAFRNKNGFTLVEIILAIAIFGMMSAVFLLLLSSSLTLSVRSGNREKAIVDAAGKLDRYITESVAPESIGVVISAPVSATVKYHGSGMIDTAIDTVTIYKYESTVDGEKVTLKGFE